MQSNHARETYYLWYDRGDIVTASGRVIDHADSLDRAAEAYPDATFRVTTRSTSALSHTT